MPAAALTSLFLINLCHAVYRCGCRSLWAGAAAHCNIHTLGSRHCPWCSIGTAGFGAVFGVILGSQLALSFWPSRWRWRTRLIASLLAFPAAGGLIALVAGWISGYWAG